MNSPKFAKLMNALEEARVAANNVIQPAPPTAPTTMPPNSLLISNDLGQPGTIPIHASFSRRSRSLMMRRLQGDLQQLQDSNRTKCAASWPSFKSHPFWVRQSPLPPAVILAYKNMWNENECILVIVESAWSTSSGPGVGPLSSQQGGSAGSHQQERVVFFRARIDDQDHSVRLLLVQSGSNSNGGNGFGGPGEGEVLVDIGKWNTQMKKLVFRSGNIWEPSSSGAQQLSRFQDLQNRYPNPYLYQQQQQPFPGSGTGGSPSYPPGGLYPPYPPGSPGGGGTGTGTGGGGGYPYPYSPPSLPFPNGSGGGGGYPQPPPSIAPDNKQQRDNKEESLPPSEPLDLQTPLECAPCPPAIECPPSPVCPTCPAPPACPTCPTCPPEKSNWALWPFIIASLLTIGFLTLWLLCRRKKPATTATTTVAAVPMTGNVASSNNLGVGGTNVVRPSAFATTTSSYYPGSGGANNASSLSFGNAGGGNNNALGGASTLYPGSAANAINTATNAASRIWGSASTLRPPTVTPPAFAPTP